MFADSKTTLRSHSRINDGKHESSILEVCASRRPFSSTAKRKADDEKPATPKPNVPQHNERANTPDSDVHSNHSFMDRLPHIPHLHRPTKEELLAAANGFWSRLRVRFKWFSIRSVRPFNIDDISGFLSWLLVGHVLWILLGTTTFFSLALLAVNTVSAQEKLAGAIGSYLTKSTGVKVIFESAIVPKWGDGVITFRNVFVSKRPGQQGANVKKGSQEIAAAAAEAAAKANNRPESAEVGSGEDTNYTQFDLSIDEVNVTLSFAKWFNSKGLLKEVEVKGVRGVIDRTHVHWTGENVDPKTLRHEHSPGDFEIESFKLRDLLVTVHQPRGFRPFPVSIYEADLPQLRKQWLFYDFLSANSMSGEIDHSLFTIHPRQTHSLTGSRLENESDQKEVFKKQSRIRIDGLNIDHLNRGVEGAFSWIHEGNVDIVADIMFPTDNDDSIVKVMSDFYDRLEATVTSNRLNIYGSNQNGDPAKHNPADDKRFLIMDLRVHLNDVRAVVPIFTRDLSYVNNALIRPIVAYINSRRTFIPLHCRVVKRHSDFDGSWTVFDSGLMDDLSAEVCLPLVWTAKSFLLSRRETVS